MVAMGLVASVVSETDKRIEERRAVPELCRFMCRDKQPLSKKLQKSSDMLK